jgi:hypothetical protein
MLHAWQYRSEKPGSLGKKKEIPDCGEKRCGAGEPKIHRLSKKPPAKIGA